MPARPLALAVVVLLSGCGRGADERADESADAGSVDGGSSDSGRSEWQGLPGARLPPLLPATNARSTSFVTSDECAFCHAAGATALRDAKGRDVSPHALWRGGMMALSARDPYYLAVLEHELTAHPDAQATVMAACTRCHAPAANVELAAKGTQLTYAELTNGTSAEARVGRDGVTCSLCHQIRPDALGTKASFTGGYQVGADRRIFGPHAAPMTGPMVNRLGYTPTESAHMLESGLCGACHTVITRAIDPASGSVTGPEVLEQGPFVEWSVSDFAKPGGRSCQSCHMPTADEDGNPLASVLSTRPANGLSARSPFARHELAGANALMLRLLAREQAWAGFDAPVALLLAQAERAEQSLRSAARLSIVAASRESSTLVVRVRVDNLTGHKLPTAYPSRRMWLHVRALTTSGSVFFESGRHANGRIVDASGKAIDTDALLLRHASTIGDSSEVQIWQAVPANAAGAAAENLLEATGFLLDNRILPAGFDFADARGALAHPIGVAGDADFAPGSDEITLRIPDAPSGGSLEVELLYQTIRPSELDALARAPGPAALRFLDMIGPETMAPTSMATARRDLP